MFSENLIEEYTQWKEVNPDSFTWWNYVNMKADLDTALGFAMFFAPEVIIIDGCLFLRDRYNEKIYLDWRKNIGEDNTEIEKMVNLYSIEDIFHINTVKTENYSKKIEALGEALKYFWILSFKERFPDKEIEVSVFKEYEDETFITVYEKR